MFWPREPILRSIAALLLASACGSGSRDVDPARLDWMQGACRDILAKRAPKAPPGTVGKRAARDPEPDAVVIYGAEWCTACHVAIAYMRRRNIPFVEKDVEKDADAAAQARAVVAEAQVGQDSLPIIDVRGTVMVRFLPCVLEYAWSRSASESRRTPN